MSGVQILILIVGAILFTVSFFIPEKTVSVKEIRDREEKAVKDIIEKEMAGIHDRIDEATSYTVEHAKETAERAMERLTNEKIMAINEYSDTVLDEIHKNHEEAVFLYDMLNNKHAQVKTTTAELNQVIKSAKQAPVVATEESKAIEAPKKEKKAAAPKTKKKAAEEKVEETKFETLKETELEVVSLNEEKAESNVEVMLGVDSDDSNSNNQILELHKAGKSNMAIARELGLGIGEVKLVIDLFEGGM